jgi:chromosome segregation protein
LKLAYVDLCGFRGFQQSLRLEFADAFTVIDGRNGVGKSTIFDAVEFALTGHLSKYRGAKASGQTVADYIWWTGSGPQPPDRYVEVGFTDGVEVTTIRRTQFAAPSANELQALTEKLSDARFAPTAPLAQLCSTSIIRDEHIAELSLDLKEADRYALVRDALGATDAETWIGRAASLVASAKRRVAAAQQEVSETNNEAALVARRIDEIQGDFVDETLLAASLHRLSKFALEPQSRPDQLSDYARVRIAELTSLLESAQALLARWQTHSADQGELVAVIANAHEARQTLATAEKILQEFPEQRADETASSLADKARALVGLLSAGRRIGLVGEACPLCATNLTHEAFARGLQRIHALAEQIDLEATQQAEMERARAVAHKARDEAAAALTATDAEVVRLQLAQTSFERGLETLGLKIQATRDDLVGKIEELRTTLEVTQRDLKIVETLRLSSNLERARRSQEDIHSRAARAQEKFSRARRAEATAQALHDAARRAAAESLDRRLDRVLPLMSELYRRLRPHPIWLDIEYSIRGDVKRFLKLQVGDDLNPQFLFSSGQRRVTGLAFLLSVNVSMAWSRWRSILLDDPVQHIDDFRTMQLAEVLAQFVADGRQVICSVEDPALADLLCRRMPVTNMGDGKRVTFGPSEDGTFNKLTERVLPPFARRTLVAEGGVAVAS